MRHRIVQLEKAIIAATVELMDCGGTLPPDTYDYLQQEMPDLVLSFDKREVIALCKRIQQAEIPKESERFQELFRAYNVRYFDSQLPFYRVSVVYDVDFWANEYYFNGRGLEEGSYSHLDREQRQIFVRLSTFCMEGYLLHEMARVATSAEHYEELMAETRRLGALGAPVLRWATSREESPVEVPSESKLLPVISLSSERVFARTDELCRKTSLSSPELRRRCPHRAF
jgi:hypothetical protein